jgi:hypothetical protein
MLQQVTEVLTARVVALMVLRSSLTLALVLVMVFDLVTDPHSVASLVVATAVLLV